MTKRKSLDVSVDPLVDDIYADDCIKIAIRYRGDSPDEPLDGDAVDKLVDRLKNLINLHEGNITEDEYWGIIK